MEVLQLLETDHKMVSLDPKAPKSNNAKSDISRKVDGAKKVNGAQIQGYDDMGNAIFKFDKEEPKHREDVI